MSNVTYERVNWEDSPSENTPINQTNLNKMDKGIADCAAAVNQCFQSASNGKALIASAITGKGVETASDATYAVMAGNITNELMKIPTETKTITSNGTHDVTDYSTITVNVSQNLNCVTSVGINSAAVGNVTCGNSGYATVGTVSRADPGSYVRTILYKNGSVVVDYSMNPGAGNQLVSGSRKVAVSKNDVLYASVTGGTSDYSTGVVLTYPA